MSATDRRTVRWSNQNDTPAVAEVTRPAGSVGTMRLHSGGCRLGGGAFNDSGDWVRVVCDDDNIWEFL